ncbi:MAG: SGNH/GDSL hydrolase family protein [Prevotella sp.]|nr:SGNH/GDSL hydrolase family protein [Prevotella sp.]
MVKRIFIIFTCLALVIPAIPQTTFTHPWQGKKVAYLGDSITDPRNSGSKKKYWGFLQDWLDITPFVYGISGRQWNDIPNQADKLHNEHGDDVDAILIFCGTNDFNNAVPIGEWYTESNEQVYAARGQVKTLQTRKMRTPIMADSTYRGRINKALNHVKKLYPTKQIVLLTPIHRGYFGPNDKNVQPTEAYQNKCGEYVDAYVQSLKEAGNLWAVPVIDWNSSCGLYPLLDEHLQYFAKPDVDQLHPNDKGQERMAKTLFYQLLTLPATF